MDIQLSVIGVGLQIQLVLRRDVGKVRCVKYKQTRTHRMNTVDDVLPQNTTQNDLSDR